MLRLRYLIIFLAAALALITANVSADPTDTADGLKQQVGNHFSHNDNTRQTVQLSADGLKQQVGNHFSHNGNTRQIAQLSTAGNLVDNHIRGYGIVIGIVGRYSYGTGYGRRIVPVQLGGVMQGQTIRPII